jgi:hypothetical protein
MGINSTEVSYGFGQLGSIFSDTTTTPMTPPTGKVFVAIHFLEATTLATNGGLVAQNDVSNGIEYAGTTTAAHDAALSPDLGESGTGGTVIDVSNSIPAGTIIYGRYTQVKASANKMIIAYIGN